MSGFIKVSFFQYFPFQERKDQKVAVIITLFLLRQTINSLKVLIFFVEYHFSLYSLNRKSNRGHYLADYIYDSQLIHLFLFKLKIP